MKIVVNKYILNIQILNRGYDFCESSPPLKSTKNVLITKLIPFYFFNYNRLKLIHSLK